MRPSNRACCNLEWEEGYWKGELFFCPLDHFFAESAVWSRSLLADRYICRVLFKIRGIESHQAIYIDATGKD